MSMEKGMCEGSEWELPRVDEEATSGSESSESSTPTMSDPSATRIVPSSSSSAYQSARIGSLRASRSVYESPVEFEIASSKSHWTDLESDEEAECSPEDNLKYFQSLQLQYEWAFNDPAHFDRHNLVVGKKIAEGGQAEIYEVKVQGNAVRYVVKVFKKGYSVRSLHRQWPPELLAQWKRPDFIRLLHPFFQIEGAILLNDERFSNRFAFVMPRAWGDLRKHIDMRMLNRNHKRGCPPFSTTEATHHMQWLAWDMNQLHEHGILHRDLKASNVLLWEDLGHHYVRLSATGMVADFECSVGVVGTGFWRAPEILQQLKDGVSMSRVVFTTKADVYSFGMTCYEIVTGCTPFEGLSLQDYDHVLSGNQPTLPEDLDPLIKKMIRSCWHLDPVKRPSFRQILEEILI